MATWHTAHMHDWKKIILLFCAASNTSFPLNQAQGIRRQEPVFYWYHFCSITLSQRRPAKLLLNRLHRLLADSLQHHNHPQLSKFSQASKPLRFMGPPPPNHPLQPLSMATPKDPLHHHRHRHRRHHLCPQGTTKARMSRHLPYPLHLLRQ